MNHRALLTAAALLASSTLALAQELPPGYGVRSPSGSKLTTTIGFAGDVDDYVFDGFPGQTIKVSLKQDKKATAFLDLILQRPDGTTVSAADGAKLSGKENAPKIKFTADQTGVWKVRVKLPDGQISSDIEYTVQIKYGKPKNPKLKDPALDMGQFTFKVPAEAGATVTAKFKHKGGSPTFFALRDPNGEVLPDAAGLVKTSKKKIELKKYEIPADGPIGEYEFVVMDDAADPAQKVSFTLTVKLPKGEKKRKGKLDSKEPTIVADPGVQPPIGGANANSATEIAVSIQFAVDENVPLERDNEGNITSGGPRMFIGDVELLDVDLRDLGAVPSVVGTVPLGVRVGQIFDVVIETATGQVAVAQAAFETVAPPRVTSVTPNSGPNTGSFEATLIGENFRNTNDVRLMIDGGVTTAPRTAFTPTAVTFTVPPRAPGDHTLGIFDNVTQLKDELPIGTFNFLFTPIINRVAPNLTPVLGGDTIFVSGVQFSDTDILRIERDDGSFEELTGTYVNETLHSFTAPVRGLGEFLVQVEDDEGIRSPGNHRLTYFSFADGTELTTLQDPPSDDLRDAYTTTLADYDNDGDQDLFLSWRGDPLLLSTSTQTRIFRNDGSGALTDVTEETMPDANADDDWRATRIWVSDVTEDGFADILLSTADETLLDETRPRVRILVSQFNNSTQSRFFEDLTEDLMAPVRIKLPFTFGTNNPSIADNWQAHDMWVGDIDADTNEPPEIVITTDNVFSEENVGNNGWNCDPPGPGYYCSLVNGVTAAYAFYWGGTRAFTWDNTRRNGNGQYRFEFNFFPRASGVIVPQTTPSGQPLPACRQATPCLGTFTPFIGQKLAVGPIDLDSKPDFAVLNDGPVSRDIGVISSLQVALNVFNNNDGALVTDVTAEITAEGGDTKGEALGLGQLGFPDNNSFGTVVISKRSGVGATASVMRVFQFENGDDTIPVKVDDVSRDVLPSVAGTADKLEAAAIEFVDIDNDGDQDMIAVAPTAPGGDMLAFRLLRNVAEDGQVGILREELRGILQGLETETDHLEADVLQIGDLDGDGLRDFVITRTVPVGTDTQTRMIRTIREE